MDKDKLEDLIGNQQMTAHRYGSFVTNRIVKLLERIDNRITLQIFDILDGLSDREIADLVSGKYTTRRLIRLRDSIRELQKEVTSITSSVLGDEGKKYAGYEADRAGKILVALGVIDVIGVGITPNQLYAAAMSRPMQGRHIRDHIKDLSLAHRKEIMAAITEGYSLGETTADIMRRIRGTVTAKRSDGLLYKRNGKIERLIVRNSLSHISSVASIEKFKELEVEEYYLSPVFDGRTSPICRSLNSGGITYYEVGRGLVPPLHPGGCRTIPLARVRGSGDISKPFVNDKRPVSQIPKDERKGKIGQTTAKSFEAHLRRQPVSLQKEWLGEKRFLLWRKGMKLGKFADPRKGVVYNLDELKQRNAKIFKDLGL